jgi:hypothetical protein
MLSTGTKESILINSIHFNNFGEVPRCINFNINSKIIPNEKKADNVYPKDLENKEQIFNNIGSSEIKKYKTQYFNNKKEEAEKNIETKNETYLDVNIKSEEKKNQAPKLYDYSGEKIVCFLCEPNKYISIDSVKTHFEKHNLFSIKCNICYKELRIKSFPAHYKKHQRENNDKKFYIYSDKIISNMDKKRTLKEFRKHISRLYGIYLYIKNESHFETNKCEKISGNYIFKYENYK